MIHSQLYLIWPTCNIFGRMLPLFLWNTFLSSKAACSQSFSHNTLDSFQYSFLVSLHISLNSKHWSVLGISLQSSLYLHFAGLVPLSAYVAPLVPWEATTAHCGCDWSHCPLQLGIPRRCLSCALQPATMGLCWNLLPTLLSSHGSGHPLCLWPLHYRLLTPHCAPSWQTTALDCCAGHRSPLSRWSHAEVTS